MLGLGHNMQSVKKKIDFDVLFRMVSFFETEYHLEEIPYITSQPKFIL